MQSDISRLLKQRGHEVTREGQDRDILLPANASAEIIEAFKTILYNIMRYDEFRKALRDWAYDNASSGNARVRQQVEAYISLCRSVGDWQDTSAEANRRRYSATFEWYVSELLKREFAARASGFGIRLRDANPDDEFDCIALLDKGLVFVECKTGRGDLYGEIAKYVRRDAELSATYSFFVFDRDYTFGRGREDAPKLSKKQASDLGIQAINEVAAGGQKYFYITTGPTATNMQIDRQFFMACTTFRGFETRIRYMIRQTDSIHERRRYQQLDLFKMSFIEFTQDSEPT
jgi:hypothetical protein